MRPGVEVISRAQPVPRSAPTDTGVWFAVGETAIGPVEPTLVRSMTQYEEVFGDRAGGVLLYDSVESYFREGGNRVWISAIPTTPSTLRAPIDRGGRDAPRSKSQEEAETRAAVPQDFADALDRFTRTLGPGQVSVPGVTDTATHQALLQHAADCNRVALLDADEDEDYALLLSRADALRALATARYGALFAPWGNVPGIAAGTHRVVPYSAIAAGIIARNDAFHNPNQAAAGGFGQAAFALYVEDLFTDSEYESLNEGGVNMARMVYGGVETYGFRTLVDPDDPTTSMWRDLGWARLNMAIVAQAAKVGELYVFSQIDGRGVTIAAFGGDLRAMLLPFYNDGALYGVDPDDAFDVDVGNQVNTPETIANGELHAVLQVRMAPMAELVQIEIVKVSTTQTLAA